MSWPANDDGDVFRSLEANGFDFSMTVVVEFNVDLEIGQFDDRLVDGIYQEYPDAVVSDEEDYLLVQLKRRLTYELVIAIQTKLSEIAEPWGGKCESWGVLA